jgi:hypothetical protein
MNINPANPENLGSDKQKSADGTACGFFMDKI